MGPIVGKFAGNETTSDCSVASEESTVEPALVRMFVASKRKFILVAEESGVTCINHSPLVRLSEAALPIDR